MHHREKIRSSVLLLAVGFLSHCGGGTTSTSPVSKPAIVPALSPVVLVVEENQSYTAIIGNPAMPYLNSLANQYGLAANYFANAHPSLPNYFMLTTGQTITTNNSFAGPVTDNNLVRELLAAGKTWKSYAESLPSAGYTGPSQYPYVVHHNPFAYFSDVLDNAPQKQNLVPFEQFAADLDTDDLPSFSFIIPNLHNNLHDCPAGMATCTFDDKAVTADAWLEANIGPLVTSPRFQQRGLLIVTFDEGDPADTQHGGGRIAEVVVSPQAKRGFKSTTFYQHQSTLRLILQALGVAGYPGAAADAPGMGEFFVQP